MTELFQNLIEIFSTQANTVLFVKQIVMWVIGGVLIYLAIAKQMEPTLLLPMGFGAILMNIPNFSSSAGISEVLGTLYNAGIANELFPLLLFIGIGAMIDFGPILSNPKLMIFGAAAQFGIFMTLSLASLFFDLNLQSCPTLCDPIDGSPPGSPIPGILQTRILEWVAISFSNA